MFILVSYDIPDNKRRNKIAKILEGYGDRVQYSVFECNLSARQFEALLKELKQTASDAEDSIRAYRLCAACAKSVQTLGRAEPPQEDPNVYIV
ncbi:MAG: CRISPR-associated endonuclease Cas2 [Caldilineae bacterium]|nr:MAG: CRISPR-associated endonuclease Cas2 [Caldilineae bacterium]